MKTWANFLQIWPRFKELERKIQVALSLDRLDSEYFTDFLGVDVVSASDERLKACENVFKNEVCELYFLESSTRCFDYVTILLVPVGS